MDPVEESIGSAKPPKPLKTHDPERSKRLLLQVIASVITAFPYAFAMTGLSLSPVEPD